LIDSDRFAESRPIVFSRQFERICTKEMGMLRTRLAALTLIGGLCLLSGCNGFSFFNRQGTFFHSAPACADCEGGFPGCCGSGAAMSGFEGPVLTPDDATVVPPAGPAVVTPTPVAGPAVVTPTPVAGPPRLIPTPQAPITPYNPH
jgi:hypothetical protein